LVSIQGMYLELNHFTGSIPNTFCMMDSNPDIRIDCDKVKCACCLNWSRNPCPTWYPTTAPTLSLSPSTTPSLSPSFMPSNSQAPTQELINITIEFFFDFHPHETGWKITDVGNNTIQEMPFETYKGTSFGTIIYEQVSLTLGYEYTFNLLDSLGDGFDGAVIVYLGDEANLRQMLGFYHNLLPSFSNHYEIPFLASEEGIIPNARSIFPTSSPSLEA